MSPTGKDEDEARTAPDQAAGVLGNLPHTRPAVRSPRRATAPPEPEPAVTAAAAAPGEDTAPGEASSQAELEALARTGIAIAGGAATLGLRIAGRAAAALRGAVDRS
jgi:hypothetical protein